MVNTNAPAAPCVITKACVCCSTPTSSMKVSARVFREVQRVRVKLTRTVAFTPTVTRSFLFVAECFGTVATLTSQPNESANEFSSAAEVRRLAP